MKRAMVSNRGFLIALFVMLLTGIILVSRHGLPWASQPSAKETRDFLPEPAKNLNPESATKQDPPNSYGWLKRALENEARERNEAVTVVAIQRAILEKENPDSGYLDNLLHAFIDEPEVFLKTLKATGQGREAAFAIAAYLDQAQKRDFDSYSRKAYEILNPGSGRTMVAIAWAGSTARKQGVDQAIEKVRQYEMPEERVQSAMRLRRLGRSGEMEFGTAQLDELQEILKRK